MASSNTSPAIVPRNFLAAFILTTCCFSLWGFANDYTNPLVKVYEQVFIIPTSQAAWLQFAFYFGYFCMALPAAFFIRRFSYKGAILVGLALYAIGALLAIPASLAISFPIFVLGSYIIPCGLAFLETACNPYILAMGPRETATQRLNLAQAFNPIGSLTGMAIATFILAPQLEINKFAEELGKNNSDATKYLFTPESTLPEGASIVGKEVVLNEDVSVQLYEEIPVFSEELPGVLSGATSDALKGINAAEPEEFKKLQSADLANVRTPYLVIAAIVVLFFLLFAFSKLPTFKGPEKEAPFLEITSRIFRRGHFAGGVVAQAFYIGAQIMCWTYIIHYGMEEVGLSLAAAQKWNIASMILFLSSRFVCTWLLRIINPGKLLMIFAMGGFAFVCGAILAPGYPGLICLVCVSGCMSLMFPTIYGIALENMEEEEAKLGSAFLIMAIVGGAVGAKIQGNLITSHGVPFSFTLVAACFIVIAGYGYLSFKKFHPKLLSSENSH
ncbi:MFS transporter [Akkermansiaceae bacterium]|nr:MFS transporter [Akkermansiaceae bacterium]